ncbi:MAG: hypothetical protein GTO41_25230, partial [Burkholderiales bacterium]|nr:hypothetical protein [Burkholderiales bacterium]
LTHLIKSLNWTQSGLKVELYDAQAALNTLARAHGLLKEQHEMSGEIAVRYVNDWRGPKGDD